MGKSSNPMQEHHRQKRIKEIQKNKQQRIKARDEKVVQTKTVASVQEEIKNLKRRKNLQPAEQQKLQRLEKELRLVQTAAENQPKPTTLHNSTRQNLKNELDDPRKSIYYDETLNPFGAPPPGKPRLYHALGGGVTMDIKMAIVPGQALPPPPPPTAQKLPPSNAPRDSVRQPQHDRGRFNKPPAPSHPADPKKHTQPDTESKPVTARVEVEEETTIAVDPNVQPALPEPSRAVQRSRRHKATVDVWASTEEVVYERQVNQVDLEADDVGAAAPKKEKKKDKKKPPLEFCYQDRAGQIQGPFPKAQIQEWFNAGYFPPSTLVRSNRNDQWVPMGSVQALQPEAPKKSNDTKEDRIAALKQERSSSVEDRIAALKKATVSETHGGEDHPAQATSKPEGTEEDVSEESDEVQRRIAAMRRDILTNSETLSDEPVADNAGNSYNPAPGPPMNIEERNVLAEPLPPGPSVVVEDPPPYYVDHDDSPEGPPPAYPIDEGDLAIAPYPTSDGDDEPPPYPLDEDAVGPYEYPVDASEMDIPYPTDTTYYNPSTEATDGEEITINPYPTDEGELSAQQHSDSAGGLQGPSLPPVAAKPVVKVDKAVVSMLPTNILNRKRKQPQPPTSATHSTKRPNKETTEFGGDYDKFMQEIDEL